MTSNQAEEVRSITPSSLSVLTACPLRYAKRTKGMPHSRPRQISSPAQGLGLIGHHALKVFVDERWLFETNADELILRAWDIAVERYAPQATASSSGIGHPTTWRKANLVREQARLASEDLASILEGFSPTSVFLTEHELRGQGPLWGIADLIAMESERIVLIDYKTGRVVSEDGSPRLTYERQLRLYSFLVHECMGSWPAEAWLLPFGGSPLSVAVEPISCETEAERAVSAVEQFNEVRDDPPANPSAANCSFCRHVASCEPFWEVANTLADEGFAAARGVVASVKSTRLGGAVLAVDESPLGAGSQLIKVRRIDTTRHPIVGELSSGDPICVTGLVNSAKDPDDPPMWQLSAGGRIARIYKTHTPRPRHDRE